MKLYNYKFKTISVLVTTIAVVFFILNSINIIKGTNYELLSEIIILIGILGIIFSKEKKEEQNKVTIKQARYNAFKLSFFIAFATIISFGITHFISDKEIIVTIHTFAILGLIMGILYLFVFYISLFLKPDILEKEDMSLKESVKKYSLFYIIYSLILGTIILLLFIF